MLSKETINELLIYQVGQLSAAQGQQLAAMKAAEKLSTITYQKKLTLPMAEPAALALLVQQLTELAGFWYWLGPDGLLPASEAAELPAEQQLPLAAMVGGGLANMNPTVVCVDLQHSTADQTTLQLFAAAKEGLRKQRAAQKTVERLQKALQGKR